jgi:uncharacterized protein YjbI with pentapeptide repeats
MDMTIDLASILEEHAKWLNNDGGEPADLHGANLRGADITSHDTEDLRERGAIL